MSDEQETQEKESLNEEMKILLEWAKKKLEEEKKKEEEKKRKEILERLQRFFPGIEVPDDLTSEDLEKVVGAIEKFAERCNYEPVISRMPQIGILEAIRDKAWYFIFGIGVIIAGAVGYLLR